VGEKEGESFETTKGVRQGCPLSPLLFTIYVADVDEMLKKAQAGGVVVGREKVWSLAFADDMVIVAKSEREMKEMMRNLEKYVRKKKLEVNVEKTKMMVFSKRKRKNEESEWKWEESKIERVSEFKYLGYTFNERATVRAQVREVVKKANKVVGCVWGIGERMWGRRVREENDDVREHGGERADVRSRDMGMEGTGGGGEGAREIFEMGARSGQRNTRVHSEGRVQEEQAESKSGKESGKVRGQNGRKGRMQDTD
jgi:hypothetical protein